MKITRSAVYKLSVTADCGCQATGEYVDASLSQAIAKHFKGCQQHGDAEAIGSILFEVVDKEAQESAMATQPGATAAISAPVSEATATSPVQIPVVRATPTEHPRVLRPSSAERHVNARTPEPERSANGQTPHTERRAIRPFRRTEGQLVAKTHVASALPLNGVEEDYRVTALIEETGLLDRTIGEF